MASQQVWIVEDDIRLANVMSEYLKLDGYVVQHIPNGSKLLQNLQKSRPDIILLDIMMPGRDGLSLCKEVIKTTDIPVIFITAKNSESDRLLGFEYGADDYITKPFNLNEMVYRVKSILKRISNTNNDNESSNTIKFEQLTLDNSAHRAFAAELELTLTPIEFNMLVLFTKNPNTIFTRVNLIESLNGYEYKGYDRSADFHIKNLRRKLSAALPDKKYIKTVRGVGFRFV